MLSIGHSGLSGTVPAEIGQLVNLTVLFLEGNREVFGALPVEITNVENVAQIELTSHGCMRSVPR